MIETIVEIFSFLLQGVGYFFAGLIVLVILTIILGDRKLWEYEVQGYCDACTNNKIEVEIKCSKKKGTSVEIEGKFKPEYIDKAITLLLNGYTIASFTELENNGAQYKLEKRLQIDEPKVGDTLSVELSNREIFSQRLYAG